MLEPVKLQPVYKHYLWGGRKLKEAYAKEDEHEILAESWELSCHGDGESKIASGPYKGIGLGNYVKALGTEALGSKCEEESLPILIKFIDAREDLSIQVHLDDTYALHYEHDHGKTEMWIILDHEPGACLYCGTKESISKEEFRMHVEDGTLPDILQKIEVHKGDVFYIEAGTIHAVGAGIVLCEIQQASNVTYRISDYKRKDQDGNTRPLQLEKALEVSNLNALACKIEPEEEIIDSPSLYISLLRRCTYFTVYKYRIQEEVEFHVSKTSFCCISALEGEGTLCYDDQCTNFQKGETMFIPAQDHMIKVQGACEFLVTTL